MSAYQSINIIMEGDDHNGDGNHGSTSMSTSTSTSSKTNDRNPSKNSNSNNNNMTPSEVICFAHNNSNSLRDEEEVPANATTSLLKGTTRNSNRNSSTIAKANHENNKFIFASSELKKAILHKPWLSAYIMLSTLFFGFAIGFATGYLAYEKGYFHDNGNRFGNDSYISNHQSEIQEGDLTISARESEREREREREHERERTKKEKEERVWEFLDTYLFHELPSMSSSSSSVAQQQNPLLRFPFQGGTTAPRPLIYLNRADAYSLFIDSISGGTIATMSQYSNDFFLISSGLDAQVNQAYCGVATAVGILNSLRFLKSTINDDGVNIPVDPVYKPYPYATQTDIFDECTKENVISQTGGGPGVDGILTPPYGLSMPQIAGLLRCHLNATTASGIGWSVQEQYVDKSHITPGKMRFDLKNALSDPNSRVLVNYDRSAIGQEGGGHWSPVGSYSEKQDAFLILDVAKYKYPPVWIPTERLFDALATYDNCGVWDFPGAQDKLSQEERMTHTKEGYAATMTKLGCKKELRGYITVTRT